MLKRALCMVLSCLGSPAKACDTALLLAVDVSGSIDAKEYQLQMNGLAAALRDGAVVQALIEGQSAIAVMQWTGEGRQNVSLPWQAITSGADAEALTKAVEEMPRVWDQYSTAIGDALNSAIEVFEAAPVCHRQMIDLSGDGVSNEGVMPKVGRDRLADLGVTINALAIETEEADLTGYFWENVITGDAAFVATAQGFEDYPETIRQKLLRELTQQTAFLE